MEQHPRKTNVHSGSQKIGHLKFLLAPHSTCLGKKAVTPLQFHDIGCNIRTRVTQDHCRNTFTNWLEQCNNDLRDVQWKTPFKYQLIPNKTHFPCLFVFGILYYTFHYNLLNHASIIFSQAIIIHFSSRLHKHFWNTILLYLGISGMSRRN